MIIYKESDSDFPVCFNFSFNVNSKYGIPDE